MKLQKKIDVSLSGSELQTPVRVVAGNTGIQLILNYVDFEIPEGTKATLFVRTPYGEPYYQEDNIVVDKNTVTIDLENAAIMKSGHAYFSVELKNGEDTISTFSNYFDIDRNLKDSTAAELKSLATFFERMIQKLKNFVSGLTLKKYNANEHGVLPENDPLVNSQNLQALMDELTEKGGNIYIPAGTYRFGENLTTEYAKACIKLRSNVNIKGDGFNTILKPVGNTEHGLDLFHHTSISYSNDAEYLQNCTYKNFTINGDEACLTGTYSAMGKGFMISPMKNVHFKKINVQNTDGTGIGVDCPVNCSAVDCVTYNCGKAGDVNSPGASGIGIGFGYHTDECMYISRCKCVNNKRFGIFFEHQKRFDENANPAATAKGFIVSDCICYENYYNFGGVLANDVIYRNCISKNAKAHGYFFSNSVNCNCEGCYSEAEANTAFVVLAQPDDFNGKEYPCHNVNYIGCTAKLSPNGVKIVNQCSGANADKTVIKDCYFNSCYENNINTKGALNTLILQGNVHTEGGNNMAATVANLVDEGNTWNEKVTGGASSWNDLKDRPFGEEEVELFPETTIDISMFDGAGMVYLLPGNPIDLIEGEKYTVLYNGKVYESICHLFNGVAPCLGSTQESYNENEPYLIADGRALGLNSTMFMPGELILGDESLTEETTWTLGISKNEINPIPEKYLPETVAKVGYTEEYVLPETEFAFTQMEIAGMQLMVAPTTGVDLIPGETYVVNWGGTTYSCECSLMYVGQEVIGNLMVVGATNSGEPFVIGRFRRFDDYLMCISLDGSTSKNISIYGKKNNKIDSNHISHDFIDLTKLGLPEVELGKPVVSIDCETDDIVNKIMSRTHDVVMRVAVNYIDIGNEDYEEIFITEQLIPSFCFFSTSTSSNPICCLGEYLMGRSKVAVRIGGGKIYAKVTRQQDLTV